MSPDIWPSKVAKAAPGSKWLASTLLTQVLGGRPGIFFVRFTQVLPPSRVSCKLPSSVPAHIILGSLDDSLMAKMVSYFSASELSIVTPPDSSCFSQSGFWVVKSGEMRSQESP